MIDKNTRNCNFGEKSCKYCCVSLIAIIIAQIIADKIF